MVLLNFPLTYESQKPLSHLCTLGIGGPARFYAEVRAANELQQVLAYCYFHKLRFFILGKGSNCLFDDRGFDGLIIANKIDFLTFEQHIVTVGAGFSFARLGQQTARKELTGLEFAAGIPATVGGAIFMNAGANGQETKDCLDEVTFIDQRGELKIFRKDELEFGYRTSSFQKLKGAIVEARFSLKPLIDAKERQKKIVDYRLKTQPYGEKSAGCAFKNPDCLVAGALIEQAGLKGFAIGDAEVSSLHGNFIINKGAAKASDVFCLISHIKSKVKECHGIDLHEEVWFVPYQEIDSSVPLESYC